MNKSIADLAIITNPHLRLKNTNEDKVNDFNEVELLIKKLEIGPSFFTKITGYSKSVYYYIKNKQYLCMSLERLSEVKQSLFHYENSINTYGETLGLEVHLSWLNKRINSRLQKKGVRSDDIMEVVCRKLLIEKIKAYAGPKPKLSSNSLKHSYWSIKSGQQTSISLKKLGVLVKELEAS